MWTVDRLLGYDLEHRTQRDLERLGGVGEYTLRHLASHLYDAGQRDKLYRLLVGNRAWMEAKRELLAGHTAYSADLDLALGGFLDPLAPDEVPVLIQLYTARQVIEEQVGVYDHVDLRTLVWLSRQQEALAHARLRLDYESRFNALMAIWGAQAEVGAADQKLLDEALGIARGIQNPDKRDEALCSVAVVKTESGWVDQTLNIAREIESPMRQAAVRCTAAGVLAQGGDTRADQMRDEGLKLIRDIQDDESRQGALAYVALALAQAGQVETALDITRYIDDSFQRADVLRIMGVSLALSGDDQVNKVLDEVRHTFADARGIAEQQGEPTLICRFVNPGGSTYDLWRVAIVLAQAGYVEEALDAAHRAEPTEQQVRALCNTAIVLHRSGDARATDLVNEALDLARHQAIDVGSKARMLQQVAATLARVSDDRAAHVLDEALDVERGIKYAAGSRMMRGVAIQALADAGQIERALGIVHSIEDPEERRFARRPVDKALARLEQAEKQPIDVTPAAREAALKVEDARERARVLCRVAVALTRMQDDQAREMFAEALGAAQDIADENDRAEAVSDVGVALAEAGEDRAEQVLNEALDLINSVTGDVTSMDFFTLPRVLGGLIQIGQVARALALDNSYTLDQFLQTVAHWSEHFEHIEPGLSVAVLSGATRVAGWMHAGWREVYEILRDPPPS